MPVTGAWRKVQADGHVEVAIRKASQRIPILALIDPENSNNVANIPRNAWEPLSYLASEMEESRERINAMPVPGCEKTKEDKSVPVNDSCRESTKTHHEIHCLEWVRRSALKDWSQCESWIRFVLTNSQSVDALRSWQLVGGLQSQNQQARPSGQVVMPDFPQPQPPGPKPKRGILSRSG